MNCLFCHTPFHFKLDCLDLFLMQFPTERICVNCDSQFQKSDREQILFALNPMMEDYLFRYTQMGDFLLKDCFTKHLKAHLQKTPHSHIVPIPFPKKRVDFLQYDPTTSLLNACHIPYQISFNKPSDSPKLILFDIKYGNGEQFHHFSNFHQLTQYEILTLTE